MPRDKGKTASTPSAASAGSPLDPANRPIDASQATVLAVAALVIVTGAMFFSVLTSAEPVVLSYPGCDLAGEFLASRQFGFGELAKGNLALWNPHLYGGVPYFGNFQSALLYPPNWLFMLLPGYAAVNWTIALHVLLLGLAMLAWGRLRGLSHPAALLAAVLVMFGGAHFMHIYAGHLSNLCTMAWVPLLLAAVDGCFERRSLTWPLIGALAVAMMVLAGHPQYVFFGGIVAAIYTVARVPGLLRGRTRLSAAVRCGSNQDERLAGTERISPRSTAAAEPRGRAVAHGHLPGDHRGRGPGAGGGAASDRPGRHRRQRPHGRAAARGGRHVLLPADEPADAAGPVAVRR